eukprot:scaffold9821_cov140-Isochrysis_galbana.AAC.2
MALRRRPGGPNPPAAWRSRTRACEASRRGRRTAGTNSANKPGQSQSRAGVREGDGQGWDLNRDELRLHRSVRNCYISCDARAAAASELGERWAAARARLPRGRGEVHAQ